MNLQEQPMSGTESLHIIQSMIQRARNQFGENGHLYLVWGYVVLVCSVAQFILQYFYSYEKHYLVWVLTIFALIYQVYYLASGKKMQRVRTYTGDIIGQIWIVFGVLMFLICFILGFRSVPNNANLYAPVILSLYGMPSFLSGRILQFSPLVTGGICCWLLALIALFIPTEFQALMFGVAVITAWIIPGYLLKKKLNNNNE